MNRRRLGAGVLVAGPTGRAELLGRAQDAAPARARLDSDPDALARDLVESGLLNWTGPATIVLIVSDGGGGHDLRTREDLRGRGLLDAASDFNRRAC